MRVLRFDIRLPTGHTEQLTVEHERALIGSGAHCEIRLPIDQAKVEHAVVELTPAGLFARAQSFEPPPTLNGIPFTQSPLPQGAVLGVNQVQIRIEVVDSALAPGASQQQQKKNSPIVLVALPLLLMACYYLFFMTDPGGDSLGEPGKLTELWGPAVADCARPGPQALAFANQQLAIAEGKRERRPFYVQDGVSAVPVYETAAACFRVANEHHLSSYCGEVAKALRKELADDYRTHHLRLEHLLKAEDWATAQKEVRILLAFTEGKSGEYVEWLRNLDRNLKLKVGRT
jgi:hypothetical protein